MSISYSYRISERSQYIILKTNIFFKINLKKYLYTIYEIDAEVKFLFKTQMIFKNI